MLNKMERRSGARPRDRPCFSDAFSDAADHHRRSGQLDISV